MTNKGALIKVGLMVVTATFLGLGWLLLSLPALANTPPAIAAGNFYFHKLRSALKLDMRGLPYSVRPVQAFNRDGGKFYIYALLGKFDGVDFNRQVLYLQANSGRVFGFRFQALESAAGRARPRLKYREVQPGLAAEEKTVEMTGLDVEATVHPFLPGDVFLVYWDDARPLTEILAAAGQDPDGLVNPDQTGPATRSITRLIYDD